MKYSIQLEVVFDSKEDINLIPKLGSIVIKATETISQNGYPEFIFEGKEEELIEWLDKYYGEDDAFFHKYAKAIIPEGIKLVSPEVYTRCWENSKIFDTAGLDTSVKSICIDLENEGFQYEEIVQYLIQKVVNLATQTLK